MVQQIAQMAHNLNTTYVTIVLSLCNSSVGQSRTLLFQAYLFPNTTRGVSAVRYFLLTTGVHSSSRFFGTRIGVIHRCCTHSASNQSTTVLCDSLRGAGALRRTCQFLWTKRTRQRNGSKHNPCAMQCKYYVIAICGRTRGLQSCSAAAAARGHTIASKITASTHSAHLTIDQSCQVAQACTQVLRLPQTYIVVSPPSTFSSMVGVTPLLLAHVVGSFS